MDEKNVDEEKTPRERTLAEAMSSLSLHEDYREESEQRCAKGYSKDSPILTTWLFDKLQEILKLKTVDMSEQVLNEVENFLWDVTKKKNEILTTIIQMPTKLKHLMMGCVPVFVTAHDSVAERVHDQPWDSGLRILTEATTRDKNMSKCIVELVLKPTDKNWLNYNLRRISKFNNACMSADERIAIGKFLWEVVKRRNRALACDLQLIKDCLPVFISACHCFAETFEASLLFKGQRWLSGLQILVDVATIDSNLHDQLAKKLLDSDEFRRLEAVVVREWLIKRLNAILTLDSQDMVSKRQSTVGRFLKEVMEKKKVVIPKDLITSNIRTLMAKCVHVFNSACGYFTRRSYKDLRRYQRWLSGLKILVVITSQDTILFNHLVKNLLKSEEVQHLAKLTREYQTNETYYMSSYITQALPSTPISRGTRLKTNCEEVSKWLFDSLSNILKQTKSENQQKLVGKFLRETDKRRKRILDKSGEAVVMDIKQLLNECVPVFISACRNFIEGFNPPLQSKGRIWRSGLQTLVDLTASDHKLYDELVTNLLKSESVLLLEKLDVNWWLNKELSIFSTMEHVKMHYNNQRTIGKFLRELVLWKEDIFNDPIPEHTEKMRNLMASCVPVFDTAFCKFDARAQNNPRLLTQWEEYWCYGLKILVNIFADDKKLHDLMARNLLKSDDERSIEELARERKSLSNTRSTISESGSIPPHKSDEINFFAQALNETTPEDSEVARWISDKLNEITLLESFDMPRLQIVVGDLFQEICKRRNDILTEKGIPIEDFPQKLKGLIENHVSSFLSACYYFVKRREHDLKEEGPCWLSALQILVDATTADNELHKKLVESLRQCEIVRELERRVCQERYSQVDGFNMSLSTITSSDAEDKPEDRGELITYELNKILAYREKISESSDISVSEAAAVANSLYRIDKMTEPVNLAQLAEDKNTFQRCKIVLQRACRRFCISFEPDQHSIATEWMNRIRMLCDLFNDKELLSSKEIKFLQHCISSSFYFGDFSH